MRLCSIPECGKPHMARGWCKAHYHRWSLYGDPVAGRTPHRQTWLSFIEALLYHGDDCLFWAHSCDPRGYAQVGVAGKTFGVSRLICEAVNGPPPSPTHEAAHSCGNGHLGCITKRHLSWKTHAENMADMIAHGRSTRGDRNLSAKLSESDVRAIRALKGQVSQKEIASRFGVSTTTVCSILNGRLWSWLHDDRGTERLSDKGDA